MRLRVDYAGVPVGALIKDPVLKEDAVREWRTTWRTTPPLSTAPCTWDEEVDAWIVEVGSLEHLELVAQELGSVEICAQKGIGPEEGSSLQLTIL